MATSTAVRATDAHARVEPSEGNDTPPARYPAEWEADAVLSDGSTIGIRPIKPSDAEGLVALHERLSPDTVYFRYFSAHPRLQDAEVEHLTVVDYVDRMALVGLVDDRVVAVARYERLHPTTEAEVAFLVEDAFQGRGIGTLLLEHLAAIARHHGIEQFVADTLQTNPRMLGVFRDAGFEEHHVAEGGVVRVTMPIAVTEGSLEIVQARGRRADARSMERVLRPRSIAVLGAGRHPGTIGHEIFRNLISGGFQGPVFPVNPHATSVGGVLAYPDLEAVPGDLDLVVVAVPTAQVADLLDQCAAKRVRTLLLITAGFAESGVDGLAMERKIVKLAQHHGMRVVGPNCIGMINTDPGVGMNATFCPTAPTAGRVAFMSQSGALGIAALERAAGAGLGLSTFVSVGNKADVSGNDLLQYWESDARTDVVMLYLESVGNPRKFARIARHISKTKPIVAVKSARTAVGSRAAQSHTAAAATPDVAVDALFRQAGVIRVDTMQEMFDTALVLANQPLPPGNRVAIVGNSGGPGILAADASATSGLEVPALSDGTQAALRALVPGAASVTNPVDLLASATPADYRAALGVLLADPGVDCVLAIYTPPVVTRPADIAEAIADAVAAAGASKPVVANFLGTTALAQPLSPDDAGRGVPWFPYPEQAVAALGRAARYAEWRAHVPTEMSRLPEGVDRAAGRALVESALSDGHDSVWLGATEATRFLSAYGITTVPTEVVTDAGQAVDAALHLGLPVALKVASDEIVHKTDVGGVQLGLATADEVRDAFVQMKAVVGSTMQGAIVQPMTGAGAETIVGVLQDPSFGPLVMFGFGGVTTDLMGDRAFRILPVGAADAAELVRSVKCAPILFGYRGSPPLAVAALEDLVVRVGLLATDVPELAEMDLNPVIVGEQGVVVVDAKIRLVRPPAGPDPLLRRL